MTLLRPFKFKPIALEGGQSDHDGVVACITGDEVETAGDDKDLTINKLVEKYGEDLLGPALYAATGGKSAIELAKLPGYKLQHIAVDDSYDMPMPRPHNFRLLTVETGRLVMTDNTGRETSMEPGDHIFIPAATSLVVLDGYATVRVALL